MQSLSAKFLALITTAMQSDGVETTINEILFALDLTDTGLLLDNVETVRKILADMNFELTPSLASGNLETARILRAKNRTQFEKNTVIEEIANGESSKLEFKSSLLYDHIKAHAAPNLRPKEYKSERVLHSCLKTIAAFINTGGGVLYLGVEDEGNCVGLVYDCYILGCRKFNADKWELNFRDHIAGKFKDGNVINDYISVAFVEVNGNTVARLNILPRKRLTFVLKDKKPILYRRQGNRTIAVEIDEVEEFIAFRKSNFGTSIY